MEIIISNTSGKPIYEQITEQMKMLIISGSMQPDEALPSIRLLAKELRISVITTKRAYDELEQEGFIYTIQGKGSFVANANKELMKEELLRKIEGHLSNAIHYAKTNGIAYEELVQILDMLYQEE